jgi:hypothetical protein
LSEVIAATNSFPFYNIFCIPKYTEYIALL